VVNQPYMGGHFWKCDHSSYAGYAPRASPSKEISKKLLPNASSGPRVRRFLWLTSPEKDPDALRDSGVFAALFEIPDAKAKPIIHGGDDAMAALASAWYQLAPSTGWSRMELPTGTQSELLG